MSRSRKKKNSVSTAIVVISLLIAGIIIMMVVLSVMYFRDAEKADEETTPEESTTAVQTTAEATTTTAASMTKVTTTPMELEGTSETEATTASETLSFSREFFQNDLFIGDSITTGLSLYEYMPAANVYAKVGLNPETAQTDNIDGVTLSEKVSAMQPRNIYIMLGTNGLAFMGADYMVNRYIEMIAMIEQACPTAKIVVITIPPVTKVHDAAGNETMEKVTEYNSRLKTMCDNGGYTCVDLCAYLQDSEGFFSDQYAEQDGLHFLGTAYIAMLGYIENSLEG